MFGWEFPPYSSGGLGTACYGLTKGLSHNNIDITFVVPSFPKDKKREHVKIIAANDITKGSLKIVKIKSLLKAYTTSEEYSSSILNKLKIVSKGNKNYDNYGNNLFEEVYRYSEKAKDIARIVDYDLIHAHDWMTFKAAINAKSISGKPLVVHIHATEFDRTGGHPN